MPDAAAPSVRIATAADIPQMADSLARAFSDDPVMAWLFPKDPGDRRKRAFFELQMRRHTIPDASGYTTDKYEGAALWAPPDKWRLGAADVLRDLPSVLRFLGRRFFVAMQGLTLVERKHPKAPHWYLATLGTEPDHQGKGIGSALMAPILERCDFEGLPAYLESSKEKNVPFYARHGFEVTEQITMPKGPPVWLMWREPRPS